MKARTTATTAAFVLCFVVGATLSILWDSSFCSESSAYVLLWAFVQHLPFPKEVKSILNAKAWRVWEQESTTRPDQKQQEVPFVDMQNLTTEAASSKAFLAQLDQQHGTDWRNRPLLFKGILSKDNLQNHRLGLDRLLQEECEVPYFDNARVGLLSPNANAPIKDIVFNMTIHGHHHKIATQLLVQSNPSILQEIAPMEIFTILFGDYFDKSNVIGAIGSSNSLWRRLFFPATMTVPLFVANTNFRQQHADLKENTTDNHHDKSSSSSSYTPLHSEPIGNIAIQITGEKVWTLIEPRYWKLVRPFVAPDGRAFFASSWTRSNNGNAPFYQVITRAGDALWVPTWTWHQVQYSSTMQQQANTTDQQQQDNNMMITIGASLFHFRVRDFLLRNGLFAVMIVPAMVRELLGWSTQ